jgi:hypothetical protein
MRDGSLKITGAEQGLPAAKRPWAHTFNYDSRLSLPSHGQTLGIRRSFIQEHLYVVASQLFVPCRCARSRTGSSLICPQAGTILTPAVAALPATFFLAGPFHSLEPAAGS